MTIEQIEPIIQAAKEGKPLQRRIWHGDEWKDVVGVPTWNFDFYVYRVKPPQPREGWAYPTDLQSRPQAGKIYVREVL